MAEFSTWHVLPMGEMPTVRQVLEMGGCRWFFVRIGVMTSVSIGADGIPCWTDSSGTQYRDVPRADQLGLLDPRPIEAPMPTPAEVGTESRWVVLCLFGLRSVDREFSRDACTLRSVDGRIEALFDGDDQWVPLVSQWGAGMVAVKEG